MGLLGSISAETYIIGGSIVTPNSEPHVVSIQRNRQHFCGASIVSAYNALTAAHCYYGPPSAVTVLAGAHNIFEVEPTQQRTRAEF